MQMLWFVELATSNAILAALAKYACEKSTATNGLDNCFDAVITRRGSCIRACIEQLNAILLS